MGSPCPRRGGGGVGGKGKRVLLSDWLPEETANVMCVVEMLSNLSRA